MWQRLSVTCKRSVVYSGFLKPIKLTATLKYCLKGALNTIIIEIRLVNTFREILLYHYIFTCGNTISDNPAAASLPTFTYMPLRLGVLDIALCNKVCQWLAAGSWFSSGTPVSSSNKSDIHDVTEILLTPITLTLFSLTYRGNGIYCYICICGNHTFDNFR